MTARGLRETLIVVAALAPAASQVFISRESSAGGERSGKRRACPRCSSAALQEVRRLAVTVLFCPACERSWWGCGRSLRGLAPMSIAAAPLA
jgi:ribosomal protein L37AE/L43A